MIEYLILATLQLAAVDLVTVHQIDGRSVDINPALVSRLAEARPSGDAKKQLHDKVNCVIWFDGGTYLSVAETCIQVRALIEKAN